MWILSRKSTPAKSRGRPLPLSGVGRLTTIQAGLAPRAATSTQNHIRPAVITVERGTRSNKITPMKTCGWRTSGAVTGEGSVHLDAVLYNTPSYLTLT